jgi:hypothetical protein
MKIVSNKRCEHKTKTRENLITEIEKEPWYITHT